MKKQKSIFHLINPLSPLKNNHGFTLVEVMIAIVILSFVMLGVVSITNNTQNTAERVVKEDSFRTHAELIMDRIRFDFEQIFTPLNYSKRLDTKKARQMGIIDPYEDSPIFSGISELNHVIPRIISDSPQEILFFTSSNRRLREQDRNGPFAWVYYGLQKNPKDIHPDLPNPDEKDTYSLIRRYQAANPDGCIQNI